MPENQARLSVLLIEDDSNDALLLKEMIAQSDGQDVQIETAASLCEGIDYLHSNAADAVLLDLSLPDADGLDALHRIHEAENQLPIVIITGLDDRAAALEAVQQGAQDYLVKGRAGPEEIRLAIRYAVERTRLQQQLLKAKEREQRLRIDKLESLGVLAGGIAHDFNNLLTGIVGNIALAKLSTGERLYELLTEAEQASLRATSLTRQLLTFSKGGEPVKEVARIPKLLRDTVSFALTGSNVSADVSVAEKLHPVEIDTGQVSQAFQNIVINADHAMPNGGKITIRAVNTEVHSNSPILLSSGPYVKVSFTDYGQGIPEDMLTKIFDPYFTTKKKGSGLGLAAAISIVQKHGGTITADSVLGEGTTFSVYLPASDKEPRQQQPGDIRDLGGGKILVLDDEPEVRKLAERYLTEMGFEVTVAEDGDNALAEYRRAFAADDPFRAVIADLTIRGGLGGKDLVSRLSRIDPGVKAIVSSGYSTDPVMSHPTEYGFCGVLPKPYRFEDLQRVLASVLGGQPEHE